MSGKKIDIFAELNSVSAGRGSLRSKVVIDFKAPKFEIDTDEKPAAAMVAQAITSTIRENMLGGKQPDGSPLPTASKGTMERRGYREKQGDRGGAPAKRYKRGTHKNARKEYRRRYRAPRLGTFKPGDTAHKGKVGLESGLLASSPLAVFKPPNLFRVFWANPRAIADESGQSAVTRVFRRIKVWSERGMEQPKIQAALNNAADAILGKRGVSLLRELRRTLSNMRNIASEVDE